MEPITKKEFQRQKVDILSHTAIIFTSRNAIDHFFTLAQQARIDIPPDMKYFCISTQAAYYLHKYIKVRKRKILTGKRTAADMLPLLEKHQGENFLFPCSNARREEIPSFLSEKGYRYRELIVYHTRDNNLDGHAPQDYDMVVFFSPSGVGSLVRHFPHFKQGNIRMAAFGPATAQAVKQAGFVLDIEASLPQTLSMTAAIEQYIIQTQQYGATTYASTPKNEKKVPYTDK